MIGQLNYTIRNGQVIVDRISVIVATFGDNSWKVKAQRALASADNQSLKPHQIIYNHGETLHGARNGAAICANGDYLIFLDADDELDYKYVESMHEAISASLVRSDRNSFLFQPSTLGIVDGREDAAPVLLKKKPLSQGNFLVIGTAVKKDIFFQAGGFQNFSAWEDWALFMRCDKLGSLHIPVKEAIYRVHVSPGSRNEQAANNKNLWKEIMDSHREWESTIENVEVTWTGV